MKPGDKAYILENNSRIVPVTISSVSGGLYTCKLPSGGAIRLNKNRIFATEEEATDHLPKRKPQYKSPYDYDV